VKVALVTHEFPPKTSGGISTYCQALASLLTAAGHDVTVVTSAPGEGSDARFGYPIVRLAESVGRRVSRLRALSPVPDPRMLAFAAFGLEARSWLTSAAAAGIEVIETVDYGGSSAFLLGHSLPPILLTCHGALAQIRHQDGTAALSARDSMLAGLEMVGVALSEVVSCYSPDNATAWAGILGRSPRFMVAPFLLPGNPEVVEVEDRRDGDRLRGVVIGRLNNWKGVFELLQALAICEKRGVGVRVRWIGRDQGAPGEGIRSVRAHLEKEFPGLWGKSFEWSDSMPVDQARRAQAAADFAVVPSRWDTFNYTAVEAMALGTPLVISSGAGASYLCADGENGLIVPPGDPVALANAFEKLRDESLRRRLAQAARRTVEREFDPERVVGMRLEGYREAISRGSERRAQGWFADPAEVVTRPWAQLGELSRRPLHLTRFGARLWTRGRSADR
jgi:glycosyltransferase involved in cell wall biosynthesis